MSGFFLIGIRVDPNGIDKIEIWVELKCPICGRDLDDDKSMANFVIYNESSHGTLRFFTGYGCFFTSNQKVAEDLLKRGKGVHVVDPQEFFAGHD